ncbi:MAG: AbrB/MazE/SpoVT family DNA-binding domain-containing protein [Verrucomicrobia bacterium]|nr:MAG: AbrB/MazE/SpoVT family DNA-binding domain-containing protein [Verrucomicrobiota bacterium]
MKLTSKGQVTIPQKLRKQFGLKPRTEVTFEAAQDGVLIKPASAHRVKQLEATIRKTRGSANAGRTTDQIMRKTRTED